MHLLDTNVVSELRKVVSGRADANVAAWARAALPGQLFISVVTLHELEHGVLLAERSDPRTGVILRRWLEDSVARVFDGRVHGRLPAQPRGGERVPVHGRGATAWRAGPACPWSEPCR